MTAESEQSILLQSSYISRDLSWLEFNKRVLNLAKDNKKVLFERLKFLSITSSNLDEFFQIRVGSLYNYLDYSKERIDYSGLREVPFRKLLLNEIHQFYHEQIKLFSDVLSKEYKNYGIEIITDSKQLNKEEKELVDEYFTYTIYPMLTPMAYDSFHSFPILTNKMLAISVITKIEGGKENDKLLSFVQVPQNLPRFFEIHRGGQKLFITLENIIRWNLNKLYRNIEILSTSVLRLTRNGDFSIEDSDDIEEQYIDEITKKLKTRKTARVVRIEIEPGYSQWMMNILKGRYEIDDNNIFENPVMIDYTGLMQIVTHTDHKIHLFSSPAPVKPLSFPNLGLVDIFEHLKKSDILIHQPFNNMHIVVDMLEKAAEDPNVLAIKITIYRLAKNSRITNALLKAAENGKHVSVLFEVKARFDEENNIKESQRLQKAGCFVVYGLNRLKTHTKLMLIVRKENDGKVYRYVHMSSGNYNEDTAKFYTDISILTSNKTYAHDVNEFFNVLTGHSVPDTYSNLITSPRDMRNKLIEYINIEAENAKKGLPAGVCIKVNSLQDIKMIDALYNASQAGVKIKLIIRGMCCLRPKRKGLSENIEVISIIGNYLEHGRIYYFHNNGDPKVYGGSADMMVRSFDRRVESLFMIVDPFLKQESINILAYNLKDNVNAYHLQEDGTYKKAPKNGDAFDIHKEFFHVKKDTVKKAKLFEQTEVTKSSAVEKKSTLPKKTPTKKSGTKK